MKSIFDESVKNFMQKKVVTITSEKSMMDVAKLMSDKSISCVVVVEGNRPVGIVTERDVTRAIVRNRDLSPILVQGFMSKPVLSIAPDTNIVHAARLMKEKNIRRFPIVKEEKLVGLITETDIMRAMIEIIRHINFKLVNTEMDLEQYLTEMRKSKLVDHEDLFKKQKK